MPRTLPSPVLRHIRRIVGAPVVPEPTDAELLQRFVATKEEDAFAALLKRHGGLVMGVCRRALPCLQDAEDAFQATFLTLARHAASIRTQAVGGWLYRVARRVAASAGKDRARRHARESRTVAATAPGPASEATLRELQTILDEEVSRLPAKYRAPFVLCCLEGKSRSEAARELGWKEGTVGGQLARARRLLQRRLTKRGVALSAALTVTALEGSAAAVPAFLAGATLRALSGGAVPGKVAALIEGVFVSSLTVKAKALTAVLLLAGVVAVAFGARDSAAAPQETRDKAAPKAQAVPAKEKEEPAITGRVLDPDGEPFVGAKVYALIYQPEKPRPPEPVAVTGADGRYRFAAPKESCQIVATADGYGPAWDLADGKSETTLRLAKDDVPVRGRVLDLQGKPVGGVAVSVNAIKASPTGKLDAWLDAVKIRKDGIPTEYEYLPMLSAQGLSFFFPPLKTDKDGRFEIKGVGRERAVGLILEGATIETKEVNALTRPGVATVRIADYHGAGRDGQMVYYAATFDHAAAPGRAVRGVVRDKETGKPIGGVVVRAEAYVGNPLHYLQTTTDKEGHYRLTGLPRERADGRDNLVVLSPEGQPYLAAWKPVPASEKLEPVALDLEMKKGVWLEGQVKDGATGKGVEAGLGYFVFGDDGQEAEARGLFIPFFGGDSALRTDKDGKFRLVAAPLRGILAARATGAGRDHYRIGIGADTIKGGKKVAGGFLFFTFPHYANPNDFDTLAEVNPKKGAASVTCDLVLDPGETVGIEVRGPDGTPLGGASVLGWHARGYWDNPGKEATFTAYGLAPGERRTLQFWHAAKKLVGSLEIKGDEREPVAVTLRPGGAVTGRLLVAGRPLRNTELSVFCRGEKKGVMLTHHTSGIYSDNEGRFCLEGIAPGVSYLALVSLPRQAAPVKVFEDLTVREGEAKDLGDVTLTKEKEE